MPAPLRLLSPVFCLLLASFTALSLLAASSNAADPPPTPFGQPAAGPPTPAITQTRYYNYTVGLANYTRLCHTKALVCVNGLYPGPTAIVNEGDKLVVNVTNLSPYNMSIHWHGVRQLLSSWSDGVAYITQCPVPPGGYFVHRFQIIGQRGTLLWHAHISWQRATVHGAFIIQPPTNSTYPFTAPGTEIPIVLGEWWNANVEDVIAQAWATGYVYNISDALTINGQPGALYNCSINGTEIFEVTQGTTYLLRIINAGMNFQFYVGVTNHTLTTVEVDAEYTEPLTTDFIVLAPGQTTTVLLTANQSVGQYFFAISVFSPSNASLVPYPQIPATAVIQYSGATPVANISKLPLPAFPAVNDTAFVANFTQSLKGFNYSRGFYYYSVPKKIDVNMLITVGYALQPCSNCSNPAYPGYRFAAGMSNLTFILPPLYPYPSTSILQAYYQHISGVYQPNFPNHPYYQYNYTAVNPSDKVSRLAHKVKVLEFGTNVQIVYQDTATLFFESHPIHLHGQNFYIVGTGFGTFNPKTDPASFNLVNPPSRNTIAVPKGGWAAVRFTTTNPGVWFMHCHIELHTTWGMVNALIVKNGRLPSQILPPPPAHYPHC